ncbi:DoxX-like family protein [Ideonella sp. YS5]|uniref:DoxX-like family protein n=1 Tax=Ideonella sp. YS5 TaxID=3453714 RepID=UPI003EE88A93
MSNSLILQIARFASSAIWLYQGIVPKLLGPHADELAMIASLGVSHERIPAVAVCAGWIELTLGLCILVFHRRVWPHALSILALAGLLAFVVMFAPGYLGAAFNPVASNVPLAAISLVAVLTLQDRTRART